MLPIRAAFIFLAITNATYAQTPRNYPYAELEGRVEDFRFIRNWRSYYWRQDCTMLVRDDAGKVHRVISREPTPWAGHRLGTTYTGQAVDWTKQPRVKIVGVRAIDRQPEEFYDIKLDATETITAFIMRVDDRDFYVNNWFHRWGDDTDRKMLKHYANDLPNYTVYGYLTGIAAPFDAEGKALLAKHPDTSIYHGRVVPAKNEIGYEVRVLHLLGRNKKTARYEIMHGDPNTIEKLDGNAPPEVKKK
ncbi:MAG: hypothetical protein EXS16_04250 [Gemmataceae bacterium]|nr:hypothetical protein [Gemmataceae bacterium]